MVPSLEARAEVYLPGQREPEFGGEGCLPTLVPRFSLTQGAAEVQKHRWIRHKSSTCRVRHLGPDLAASHRLLSFVGQRDGHTLHLSAPLAEVAEVCGPLAMQHVAQNSHLVSK